MWTAEKIWPGETVFVLAAGPSTRALDLSRLARRRVIAVKSAWKEYPRADVLFFADGRWWREKQLRPSDDAFAGLIVTSAKEIGDPRVKVIGRTVNAKQGFATRPDQVTLERSSTTGAINLAMHFGAARIVLLGVDAKPAQDGRRHNHGLRWPWPPSKSCWADQVREFAMVAPSAHGVEIVNANPDSAVTCWPRKPFEDCLG